MLINTRTLSYCPEVERNYARCCISACGVIPNTEVDCAGCRCRRSGLDDKSCRKRACCLHKHSVAIRNTRCTSTIPICRGCRINCNSSDGAVPEDHTCDAGNCITTNPKICRACFKIFCYPGRIKQNSCPCCVWVRL